MVPGVVSSTFQGNNTKTALVGPISLIFIIISPLTIYFFISSSDFPFFVLSLIFADAQACQKRYQQLEEFEATKARQAGKEKGKPLLLSEKHHQMITLQRTPKQVQHLITPEPQSK